MGTLVGQVATLVAVVAVLVYILAPGERPPNTRTDGEEAALRAAELPPALRGLIEDCRCRADSLEALCVGAVGGTLRSLVRETSLRFYRVDVGRECPFWVEEFLCGTAAAGAGGCGLCPCPDDEVPPAWRNEDEDDARRSKHEGCRSALGEATSAVVAADASDLGTSAGGGGGSSSTSGEDAGGEWVAEDGDAAEYVDLVRNPERYTGYSGYNATRIWLAIYQENGFRGPQAGGLEERVFYRLVSGFHASTTAHICEFYADRAGEQRPNLAYFAKALGAFPERQMNVYFAYAVLLRALQVYLPSLPLENSADAFPYGTGRADDDAGLLRRLALLRAQAAALPACAVPFDESEMFAGVPADARAAAVAQMRAKFVNISQVLDCVGCETCRLHARLQVHGLGAALRVLLSPEAAAGAPPRLRRNEFVALVNALSKFGDSIEILSRMHARLRALRDEDEGGRSASLIPLDAPPLELVIFLALVLLFLNHFFRG
jgi:ERO1-like protein alpha